MSTLHVQPFYTNSYAHSRYPHNLQTSCRPRILPLAEGIANLDLHDETQVICVISNTDTGNNNNDKSNVKPQTKNLTCINNKLTNLTLSENRPPQLRVPFRLPTIESIVENHLNSKSRSQLTLDSATKKINNVNQRSANRCTGHDNRTQLLHPDWRKIPWKIYFGWTDSHDKLQKELKDKIMSGGVESIYYESEEEHVAAGLTWRYHNKDIPFLRGPIVSTVSEVLEVIRRVNHSRPLFSYYGNRLSRWTRQDNLTLAEYDADDED